MGFLRRLLGGGPRHVELTATLVQPAREDATVQVVGESNYQPVLIAASGGRTTEGAVNPAHMAVLYPEPTNRYDPNAVQVRIAEGLVGYLSREDAVAYRPVIDRLAGAGTHLGALGWITGGWQRGRDIGTFGFTLHLGTPAETMAEIVLDEIPPREDHQWRGSAVAFTGESLCQLEGVPLDRAAQHYIAQRAGLLPSRTLTKKCAVLVMGEDLGTSKREQAARWGTPIVAELDFWHELGVPVMPNERRPPAWARTPTQR